jgi:PAS domain S-box-containing protein
VAVQLDRAGAVTFVNDAFLDLTGWARGEVLGAEWGDDLVPAGCASRATFAAAAGAGVPARAEGEVFTRDGGRRVVPGTWWRCATTTAGRPARWPSAAT